MLHVLSVAMFSDVLVFSVAVIIATIREELPFVIRAMGVDPTPPQPTTFPRGPRLVRITRNGKVIDYRDAA